MQYRRLGSTEINTSVIGLGTWQFGGEWGKTFTPEDVKAIIMEAENQGINFIDTAECYGDHLSEKLIGEAVKDRRESWVIATKFGHHYHAFLDRTMDFSVEGVRKQLELSLSALQTDYLDLYQFHSGTLPDYLNRRLWEMLNKEKERGRILHLGVSISNSISPEDKIRQMEMAEDFGIETVQIVYNRLQRFPERNIFPLCVKYDAGVLVRVPLASGLLSGKYQPGHRFTGEDVRASRNEEDIEDDLIRVQQIKEREIPGGTDMAAWALAWCLRQETISCVIPGCKSPEQVRANAQAVKLL